MEQLSILAIVLKRELQNECDGKVSLFSKEFGRLEVLSKGLFKINSKFSGILLEGNLIKADLIFKKNYKIFSAILEKNFLKDANFFKKFFALKGIFLFEKLVILPEKDLNLWNLLYGYLNFLSLNKKNSLNYFAFLYFELKILKILGYLPLFETFSSLDNSSKFLLKEIYSEKNFKEIVKKNFSFNLKNYYQIQKKIDFYLKTTVFPQVSFS